MHIPGWQETAERYEAWWDGTLSGGPILKAFVLPSTAASDSSGFLRYQVQPERQADAEKLALKIGMSPPPDSLGLGVEAAEETRKRYWLDLSGRLELFQAMFSGAACYGDAFYHFFPDFGSAVVASFLGVEPRYGGLGMLNESSLKETLDDVEPDIQFDPDSFWWQTMCSFMQMALGKLGRSVVVGFPNLGGALDILASLRGTQNLLMDLVFNPDTVKRLEMRMSRVWVRYYQELHSVLKEGGQEGTTSWVGVFCPGRMFPIQCDIAVMISPDMFEEFAVPSLRIQAQALDHCMFHYHAEGPRKTLEHLLNMDEIQAIQWSPGVNSPAHDDDAWLPVYRQITENGKGLLLLHVRPDRVGWLVSKLPADRLAMNVVCESEEQARGLLARYCRG
jgi:5-methyltetrahydrofolate--homocysteine methyltransferase